MIKIFPEYQKKWQHFRISGSKYVVTFQNHQRGFVCELNGNPLNRVKF